MRIDIGCSLTMRAVLYVLVLTQVLPAGEEPARFNTERVTTEILYPVGMIVSYFRLNGQLPVSKHDMIRANAEADSPFVFAYKADTPQRCAVSMVSGTRLNMDLLFTVQDETLRVAFRINSNTKEDTAGDATRPPAKPGAQEGTVFISCALHDLRREPALKMDLAKLEPVYAIVRTYNPQDKIKKETITVPLE